VIKHPELKLKLIIGGAKTKLFHLHEFADALERLGLTCKVVHDIEVQLGFPSKNIKNWFPSHKKFNALIDDFRPDIVFIDRPSHLGLEILRAKIPLLVHLRGDYWSEIKWAKQTLYQTTHRRFALWWKSKTNRLCGKKVY